MRPLITTPIGMMVETNITTARIRAFPSPSWRPSLVTILMRRAIMPKVWPHAVALSPGRTRQREHRDLQNGDHGVDDRSRAEESRQDDRHDPADRGVDQERDKPSPEAGKPERRVRHDSG
jgi:hypothetical protein